MTDASGNIPSGSEQRYYPYGEPRLTPGTMYTDKLFTGQREITGLGIYHYGARFYSPKLGRFLSPDTIIPGTGNPQAFNRYSYVLGNPMKYTDPTGHMVACDHYDWACQTHWDEPITYDDEKYTYDIKQIIEEKIDEAKEGLTAYLEGTFHPYSPMSAGNQVCGVAQTRNIPCDPNYVDVGVEAVQAVGAFISFVYNSPSSLTATPFAVTPTQAAPLASVTPVSTATATPNYTSTTTSTPANTSTASSTVTPSLTVSATASLAPTSPYITPTYSLPSATYTIPLTPYP